VVAVSRRSGGGFLRKERERGMRKVGRERREKGVMR
jgi:hypothetical protein